MNKENVTFENIQEWAESVNFSCTLNDKKDLIIFVGYNSFGKNIVEEFTYDNEEPLSFIKDLQDRINNYDVSEETSIWLDASGHGIRNAPYDIEDIIKSSKEELSLLENLYEIIDNEGKPASEIITIPSKLQLLHVDKNNFKAVNEFLYDMQKIASDFRNPYGHKVENILQDTYSAWKQGSHNLNDLGYGDTRQSVINDFPKVQDWLANVCIENNLEKNEFFKLLQEAITPLQNLDKSKGQIRTISPFMSEEQYKVHQFFDSFINKSSMSLEEVASYIKNAGRNDIELLSSERSASQDKWLSIACGKTACGGGQFFYSNYDLVRDFEKVGLILSDKNKDSQLENAPKMYTKYLKMYMQDTVITSEKMKEWHKDACKTLEKQNGRER